MWIDRIIGNVAERGPNGADIVDITWQDLGRTIEKRSRAGTKLCIHLPPGQRLSHGDVLVDGASGKIVVNLEECEVIVARPTTSESANLLCLELGNLHWPTQVIGSEVLFTEDGPPLAVLDVLGISWSRELRRFAPYSPRIAPVKLSPQFRIISRISGQ